MSFQPYADNKGSIVAIAGKDFAVIAADTRLSDDFKILTRTQSKLFPIGARSVLGSTGCWCDALTFNKILQAREKMYLHDHNREITTPGAAQMLSTMLYYKRFFPYYISNVLAGIDENGRGCVFSYDPVGHCERETYHAGGSAGHLLQPLLDNQIGFKNQNVPLNERPEMTLDRALAILTDAFISAAERDIHTGDTLEIVKIFADRKPERATFQLRND